MAWANSRGSSRGAATVIRNHVRAQGTKGNRKHGTRRSSGDAQAAQRVGGYAGANFSNDIGRQ